MNALDYFLEEIQRNETRYFIFDTKGTGDYGDIDFVQYEWSPNRYDLVRKGDLFIYRRPDKSSEIREFYFFGACKIDTITQYQHPSKGELRKKAIFSKIYPFNNYLLKRDLESFKWAFKERTKSTWEHFFNQYGMNKIHRDDFIGLISLSMDETEDSDNISFDDETESKILIAEKNYYVDDSISTITTRSQQKAFSDKVKVNYNYSCAICGINTREFLIGSHIVPWSKDKHKRLDPSNGICLCVFHDKAFDKGFITIDEKYRLRISDRIRADIILSRIFSSLDGKRIRLPKVDRPDLDNIKYHNMNIFRK